MLARLHKPAPPLDAFVDCLWYFEGYRAAHPRERALPTGTVELVVNLTDAPSRLFRNDRDREGLVFRESMICGPQSGYFVLDTAHPSTVIGVHFRAGGAAPVLGAPAQEFTDHHVCLEDVWGSEAGILRDRLLQAGSPEAMFQLLERALLRRLHSRWLPHPAAAHALKRLASVPTLARIEEVRAETGYGAKRFIEVFRSAVGLTPKVYSRIQRFQSVLARLAERRPVEWAAVALDSGYCDQPHLNREFLAFSGVTPAQYRPVSADRPAHVPIER
jgi:AraC-like DNA-binding protein